MKGLKARLTWAAAKAASKTLLRRIRREAEKLCNELMRIDRFDDQFDRLVSAAHSDAVRRILEALRDEARARAPLVEAHGLPGALAVFLVTRERGESLRAMVEPPSDPRAAYNHLRDVAFYMVLVDVCDERRRKAGKAG